MPPGDKTFYITTAIPYVNAEPHLGFALELVQADAIARFRRLQGRDVRFVTGTDENALKNFIAAREQGVDPRELINRNAAAFRELKSTLNLSWDDFIRTTEPRHIAGAQKFWRACRPEDIYKKHYRGLYCVGCEEFKTEKDLADGRCAEHPTIEPELVEEENYFFRLSAYQGTIERLVGSGELEVIPEVRRNEMLAFISRGLQDFSISRSRERAHGFGVPVPGDPSQVQYVWFDALTNYINALGYAEDAESFRRYWQENDDILHVIGKGIARFHAVYWPAMLLSAGLRLPKRVFVHGYITVNGQKISKSLGNIIIPKEIVAKYGVDPIRYYLFREIPTFEDGDFSEVKLVERYNGELANGLGNLVARVAALGEKLSPLRFNFARDIRPAVHEEIDKRFRRYEEAMDSLHLHEALGEVWQLIGFADRHINDATPWAVADPEALRKIISRAAWLVSTVANLVSPFLPETAEKIQQQIAFRDSTMVIKRGGVLFPRLG
ncbi:MAG: methionine--tRNA ligase [Candidatus Sungbacteria bacterium RIFCSPLOWO2_01_FULL_59_16]|uniref:Methionine--tRNA ligase n=1 Tax=Candidatus Sungbacteria bacterium RIFCSPLOWO2_01_FULL_59_16 TaxID=1802280 RepID=A0A1G2LBT8_9BACT|nr:MAG: methionine--tRNA ligase [Candidatus Sungbacteria bacterium RIFCSPLOWO2_01_FULL_59_16]